MLLFELFLLLDPLFVDIVKGMFCLDLPSLHIHIEDVLFIRVHHGAPWVRHGRLKAFDRDPEQVLIGFHVEAKEPCVFDDFFGTGLVVFGIAIDLFVFLIAIHHGLFLK